MALTVTENLRIQSIENTVNDLQNSLNSLATRKQLIQLLNIRQADILELQQEIEEAEHKADRHLKVGIFFAERARLKDAELQRSNGHAP